MVFQPIRSLPSQINMPIKVKTSLGFSDASDFKVKGSGSTLTDVQCLKVKKSDGTLATVWQRGSSLIPVGVDPFILSVSVGNNDTFSIPVKRNGNHWIVDWGDGTTSRTYRPSDLTHTYTTAGTYHIRIYPFSASAYGWMANFGTTRGQHWDAGGNQWLGNTVISDPAVQANLDKIVGVDGVITPQMVATAADIAQGKVGNAVCSHWFYACRNLTMSNTFTFSGWENITEVGGGFCYCMFYKCSGNAFTMGAAFNLPQNIQRIERNGADNLCPDWYQTPAHAFCNSMFRDCSGANFTMNDVFTLPQTLIMTGAWFCTNMFARCTGAAFTMGTAFNMPQNITKLAAPEIDDTMGHVCESMFSQCSGAAFNMNAVFQLPQGLLKAGLNTFARMFSTCSGAAFNMNSIFTMPQAITDTQSGFANSMFSQCSGAAFTMNSVFNAPQGLGNHVVVNGTDTSAWTNFMRGMFYGCNKPAFQVNNVFTFPTLVEYIKTVNGQPQTVRQINTPSTNPDTNLPDPALRPFYQTFYNVTSQQTRTATSIINGNITPAYCHQTFSTVFPDYNGINANWRT